MRSQRLLKQHVGLLRAENQLLKAQVRLEQHRSRWWKEKAFSDPRTGLHNGRAIQAILSRAVGRRDREPGQIAFGLLDIDHFKEINSQHSHHGGNRVLKRLARSLEAGVRSTDQVIVVARDGGDEFVVVAHGHPIALEGVEALVQRLHTEVASSEVRYRGQRVHLTLSMGWALEGQGVRAKSQQQLQQTAAEALQVAKKSGRNRSVIRLITDRQQHWQTGLNQFEVLFASLATGNNQATQSSAANAGGPEEQGQGETPDRRETTPCIHWKESFLSGPSRAGESGWC